MHRMALAFALTVLTASAASAAEPFHLIPGQVTANKGPDGNTIVLDAPKGLIVFDTGRHPEHAQAILDYAKARRRPIAAIVNSHWHLDHTTGNWDIRKAFPRVRVYASSALEGAITDFFPKSRKGAEEYLKSGKASPAARTELERGFYVMDHPELIRPSNLVKRSGPMTVAGRRLDVHLAKYAATEGDVWIYDPKTRIALAGDLVVDIVPFMDTACPEGWRKALADIERVPFRTLVPGHGPVMSRSDFLTWKKAYEDFVGCGHSDVPKARCVDGWMKDDAKFIDDAHRDYAREAADYYLTTRLRSSPEEQERYCKPLR